MVSGPVGEAELVITSCWCCDSHDQDDVTGRQLPGHDSTHLLRGQGEEVVADGILVVLLEKIKVALSGRREGEREGI